jgi:hypothetical protein
MHGTLKKSLALLQGLLLLVFAWLFVGVEDGARTHDPQNHNLQVKTI